MVGPAVSGLILELTINQLFVVFFRLFSLHLLGSNRFQLCNHISHDSPKPPRHYVLYSRGCSEDVLFILFRQVNGSLILSPILLLYKYIFQAFRMYSFYCLVSSLLQLLTRQRLRNGTRHGGKEAKQAEFWL
jgi:hypothetical protein